MIEKESCNAFTKAIRLAVCSGGSLPQVRRANYAAQAPRSPHHEFESPARCPRLDCNLVAAPFTFHLHAFARKRIELLVVAGNATHLVPAYQTIGPVALPVSLAG
jgi:hypothetical protein